MQRGLLTISERRAHQFTHRFLNVCLERMLNPPTPKIFKIGNAHSLDKGFGRATWPKRPGGERETLQPLEPKQLFEHL